MQKIKFSHKYYKMPISIARKTYLLGVTKIHYNNLPKGFIIYDTAYASEDGKLGYYPLPKTELIILTLFTDSEQSPRVWTTVRRYTSRKYEYYQGLIGKQVEIIFINE